MRKLYLITGAAGHVGSVLVSELKKRGAAVRALVRPGDEGALPEGVEPCRGDITKSESLERFFDVSAYGSAALIHCAASITIASRRDPRVWEVNVNGTDNVLRLALEAKVGRVVYVSSVHAIPELPAGQTITEVDRFSPELVHGQYAKSKAAAAQLALDYVKKGLALSIVHPSGIIGPGDRKRRNHLLRTMDAMSRGKIPVGLKGGYDVVDARDVASGILACEEKGRTGECYILTGHYITILELLNEIRRVMGKRLTRIEVPYPVAKAIAPIIEFSSSVWGDRAPLLTPYSVYTLHTNGCFSHEKATRELGYSPRDIVQSIKDSLWSAPG